MLELAIFFGGTICGVIGLAWFLLWPSDDS